MQMVDSNLNNANINKHMNQAELTTPPCKDLHCLLLRWIRSRCAMVALVAKAVEHEGNAADIADGLP